MPISYAFPPSTLFYCRACQVPTPHSVNRATSGQITCEFCGRGTHAVEVISTLATDAKWDRFEVMPPFDNLHPTIQAAKVTGRDWVRDKTAPPLTEPLPFQRPDPSEEEDDA